MATGWMRSCLCVSASVDLLASTPKASERLRVMWAQVATVDKRSMSACKLTIIIHWAWGDIPKLEHEFEKE